MGMTTRSTGGNGHWIVSLHASGLQAFFVLV
jgi:hypothetical protein